MRVGRTVLYKNVVMRHLLVSLRQRRQTLNLALGLPFSRGCVCACRDGPVLCMCMPECTWNSALEITSRATRLYRARGSEDVKGSPTGRLPSTLAFTK